MEVGVAVILVDKLEGRLLSSPPADVSEAMRQDRQIWEVVAGLEGKHKDIHLMRGGKTAGSRLAPTAWAIIQAR